MPLLPESILLIFIFPSFISLSHPQLLVGKDSMRLLSGDRTDSLWGWTGSSRDMLMNYFQWNHENQSLDIIQLVVKNKQFNNKLFTDFALCDKVKNSQIFQLKLKALHFYHKITCALAKLLKSYIPVLFQIPFSSFFLCN